MLVGTVQDWLLSRKACRNTWLVKVFLFVFRTGCIAWQKYSSYEYQVYPTLTNTVFKCTGRRIRIKALWKTGWYMLQKYKKLGGLTQKILVDGTVSQTTHPVWKSIYVSCLVSWPVSMSRCAVCDHRAYLFLRWSIALGTWSAGVLGVGGWARQFNAENTQACIGWA